MKKALMISILAIVVLCLGVKEAEKKKDNPTGVFNFFHLAANTKADTETKEDAELFLAISNGWTDKVYNLIEKGVSPNTKDKWGGSVLLRSMENDVSYKRKERLEIAKYLIEKGADVNYAHDGKVPLHHVCEETDFIHYLISKGAKVDKHPSLLYCAISKDNTDLLELYLNKGARPDTAVLQEALHKNNKEVLALLLKNGLDFENGENTYIPHNLFLASRKGSLEAVKAMVEAGADVNLSQMEIPMPGARYITPLSVAAEAGHHQIVDYLISKGANINAVNMSDLERHQPEMVSYLKAAANESSSKNVLIAESHKIHQN